VLHLQGAPKPGALLLDPAYRGLCPQTPVIGSRYRARHGAVPPRYFGLEPPLLEIKTTQVAYRCVVSENELSVLCLNLEILAVVHMGFVGGS